MTAVHWLAATLVFTALLPFPYVLERIGRLGLAGALGNPSDDGPEPAAWAKRSSAAHANAIENLVLFAPAVLLALQQGKGSDAVVVGGAMTYFIARLVHALVYTAGIPGLRTLGYFTGFIATLAVVYGALA